MRVPFFQKRLRVRDAMTTSLVTVPPNTTLDKVAKKMKENRIGNVLVVEDGKLKGIITETDIVRKAVAKNKSAKVLAKEIMTSPVKFVSPDDELMHVSDKMLMNNITRLPVVDIQKNELLGIVTIKDILRVMPGFLMDKIEWLRIHPEGKESKGKTVKGVCEVCGKYTNDLRFSRGLWVCADCE